MQVRILTITFSALVALFFIQSPVGEAAYSDTFLGGGQNCTAVPGTTPVQYSCPPGQLCNRGVPPGTPPQCVSASMDFFGVFGITSGGAGSGAGNYSPIRFWANAINGLLGLLGMFAVAVIVYGGFKFMTAGGEQDKAKSASKTIMYALFGLITIALAWLIGYVILNSIIKIIQ